MKRILRILSLILVSLIITALTFGLVTAPPIMTGMAAKTMCSCVFVLNRTPESVTAKEMQVFPGLASVPYEINMNDSTVTTSLLWETSKAIYRKGLGCTLLAEKSEAEVRAQKIITATPPSVDQDTIAWPQGNLLSETKLPNVDYAAMQNAVDAAFADKDHENPIFTHGVVVVYNGKIIGEKYAEGFTYNSRMTGWSMTKSITNALVGITVKEGKLKIDEPAPVSEWQNDERKKITVNNLLQASSGLEWSESYFAPWSTFHKMFIRSDDKAAFAASQELTHEPGTFFQYSSGTTNILTRMVRQQVGDDEYYRMPYEKLFYKIGMHTALIEPDASGTFVGSSYGYASARDWARFGLLYLNDGVWNGEQILPEGWVKYSTTPAPAAPLQQYGAQIWLNKGNPADTTQVEYSQLPHESIIFEGFERNIVVIIPSKKLVVVRLGVTHNNNFSVGDLVNGVMKALLE